MSENLEFEQLVIFNLKDWNKWLRKNHVNKKKVGMICYKKHTGKPSISHKEAMFEAICFGWIDTTLKRLDEDRYIRYFVKRGDKANWSENTLKYGKELFEAGRMSELGIKRYKEGLKKKPHDYGIPKNPDMPKELEEELEKDKIAEELFVKLSKSLKEGVYRQIIRGKAEETRRNRSRKFLKELKNKN